MYKLLLCWRYLRTRYIALASIISVMLGVATMIVVNSVMAGFSHEMQNRIHGILSDVVVESHSLNGFYDPQWHMQEIERVAGKHIAGMTPTLVVPAMMQFQMRGQWVTRQVNLIGVDQKSHNQVSDFSRFLQHPSNREQLSFDLRRDGYDVMDHQAGKEAKPRRQMRVAGWQHRRWRVEQDKLLRARTSQPIPPAGDADPEALIEPSGTNEATAEVDIAGSNEPADDPALQPEIAAEDNGDGSFALMPSDDPFRKHQPEERVFDPAEEQHTGIVLGIALASFRAASGEDHFFVLPGDDVKVTLPTAGTPPKAVSWNFTIVDFYESKMSEYDASFAFVPIEELQKLRGLYDRTTGIGSATAIQIKLHNEADGELVRDKLRAAFPPEIYGVQTWRDKQGPLLAAVQMETAILNVLLFLIIAVAGFGILAIFYMIVVEKTKDIGILKSLGASGRGIMGIFLAYGLSLGMVGSGVGMTLGLLFVYYINEIADLLGKLTGRPVFDPSIYYFQKIPTLTDPATIAWIVIGAMLIAVTASILPARRAARLHPVEALRYE